MTKKTEILAVAVEFAESHGFANISRDSIAQAAGVGAGTVNFHYSTVADLRRAVLVDAIANRRLRIIAQGIIAGAYQADEVSPELKAEALESLKA